MTLTAVAYSTLRRYMGGIDSPMFCDPITLIAISEPFGMAHFHFLQAIVITDNDFTALLL